MKALTKQPTLTQDQAEAAELVREWFYHLNTQIFVLCGYAGTGKTYLIDYIVKDLGLVAGESVAFVAPTGKAASVLVRGGTPAGTVHSLIYTREEDIEVDENGEIVSERFLRFAKSKVPAYVGKRWDLYNDTRWRLRHLHGYAPCFL